MMLATQYSREATMRLWYYVTMYFFCYSQAFGDTSTPTGTIFTPSDWLNVIALIVGPTIGVVITIVYQRIQEKKRNKLWVLGSLIANRHQILHSDNVKALNTIDLVFARNRAVRSAWANFVTTMRDTSSNDQERIKIYNALIDAMCGALGYSNEMRYLDFERVIYDPASTKSKALEEEFLSILRAGKLYIESEMRKDHPKLPDSKF